ncbi:hypothetical protein Caka_2816 [Coraliomargarita akajimensis DSM 45221]|uniref:FeoB-associated Cys-rich membrane protein n=1 Tax=Coraliomargarita akajimensis (strain DSM 45221 / IAM 15411 / JCM 23193 / KCTC 12865 / 04OKA010-24) TaxID=583355 RepID=D5EQL5_CORAD|nr:hypothetical protein Caka_2816 [Coraliomargarita akajimensis DSM 45221]
MEYLDIILTALILTGAICFLYKTFKPKGNGRGCGCGSVDCKVPKPKVQVPEHLRKH